MHSEGTFDFVNKVFLSRVDSTSAKLLIFRNFSLNIGCSLSTTEYSTHPFPWRCWVASVVVMSCGLVVGLNQSFTDLPL